MAVQVFSGTMAVSEETPRKVEKLVSSAPTVRELTLATKARVVLWTGWGLVIAGLLILGLAGALAAYWTTTAGTCYPPGGGTSVPCPASELTTNNFAVVIALMLWSGVMIVLGGVLACVAWLHKPPRA